MSLLTSIHQDLPALLVIVAISAIIFGITWWRATKEINHE